MKWTIQVFYTARDDDGKQFRAETFFQCEGIDQGAAYAAADKADWAGFVPVKFGFILPGWHDNPTVYATRDIVKKAKKK